MLRLGLDFWHPLKWNWGFKDLTKRSPKIRQVKYYKADSLVPHILLPALGLIVHVCCMQNYVKWGHGVDLWLILGHDGFIQSLLSCCEGPGCICASRVGYPELERGRIGFWFLFNLAIWHCSTSFQKLGLGLEIGLCVLTPFEVAQYSNGTHLAIKYLVNVLNVDSHDKYVLHMITYGAFAQICDCWTMFCELFCRSQL